MSRAHETANRAGMARPVAVLASGTTIAFAVGYVSKIILLRLYAPADFGVFDVLIAMAATLLPVASLRYEDAIVLPEHDGEARDLFWLSAGLSLLFVACVAIAAGIVVSFRDTLGPDGSIDARWLHAVAPVLLALRASKLFELWLIRRERFGVVAGANVTQAGVMTIVRVLKGLADPSPGGLIGGFAAGHAAAAAFQGVRAVPDVLSVEGRTSRSRIAAAARNYRRFAVYSTPSTLAAALVTRLPYFLLLAWFSAEVVGWFGQAFHVFYVPLALVTGAVGQVFFVRAARSVDDGSLPRLAESVHERLVLATVFPVAVTAAVAPDLFALLFSESWRTAGSFVLPLSGWIVLTAVGSPLTRLFDVLRRQPVDFAVTLLLLAASTAALVLGGLSGSVHTTLLLLGVFGAVSRAVQIVTALRVTGVPIRNVSHPWIAWGIPAVAASALLHHLAATTGLTWTLAAWAALLAAWAIVAFHRWRTTEP